MSDLLNNPVSFHDLAYEFATSGVYAIHCKHTDTYYIGQGTVVLRRLVDHFTLLREGVHPNDLLQREYSSKGEDEFVIGLLDDMPQASTADLLRRESEEIQRFKAHGKRLFNKVLPTVKLAPPVPTYGAHDYQEHKGNGNPVVSHAERVTEIEPTPATCYDCGTAGISQVDIFKCDDGFTRCQSCIEVYLDSWRFAVIEPVVKNLRPHAVKSGSYRRWLAPQDASIQEHILLAANNFAKRFGHMPKRVFVSPTIDAPNEYRGIEIVHGGIAVGRYIDIPIE